MGQSYVGKSWGGVANAYKKTLHILGLDLAAGARVSDGEGNDSGLKLYSNKIAVVGPTNEATIAYPGDSDQDFTLPAVGGELQTKGTTDEITRVKLAADTSALGTVAAEVSNFLFTPAADSLYLFEMYLLMDSNNTSHGIHLEINGPTAQTEHLAYHAILPQDATTNQDYYATSFGVDLSTNNVLVASTPQLVRVSGMLKTTATTPAAPVTVSIFNENVASTTTLHEDSVMVFTKVV